MALFRPKRHLVAKNSKPLRVRRSVTPALLVEPQLLPRQRQVLRVQRTAKRALRVPKKRGQAWKLKICHRRPLALLTKRRGPQAQPLGLPPKKRLPKVQVTGRTRLYLVRKPVNPPRPNA